MAEMSDLCYVRKPLLDSKCQLPYIHLSSIVNLS